VLNTPKKLSSSFVICAVVVAFFIAGAAFWGANRQSLGLFHDDGIYTVVAKSLSQGQGYRIISLPEAPPQTKYPFLYSYVLSWIWTLSPSFPQNIIVLKALNIAILVAIFFASVIFYRRYDPAAAFASLIFAILVCTNPIIFTFTDYAISDLLFVFLALVALTICAGDSENGARGRRLLVLAVVTGLACLTRLASVPLVLAGAFHSFVRRGWRGALFFIAIVALFVAPWLLWIAYGQHPPANSLFAYYSAYDFSGAENSSMGAWFERHWTVVASNARYLVETLDLLYLLPLLPGLGVFVIALTFIGIFTSLRSDQLVNWSFFLASGALLLIWPFHPGRYVAPVVPILILFLFRGANGVEHWCGSKTEERPLVGLLGKLAWLPLVLIFILNGVWLSSFLLVHDDRTTRGLYGSHVPYGWQGFEESFAWIREHAPADARLATAYDPMYYLYTGRQAIRPALHRPATYFYPYGIAKPDVGSVQEVMPELRKLRIDYLIIDPLDGYAEGKATLRLFDGLVAAYGDQARNVFTSTDGKHKIYALRAD
jgi:4-amino-4-deoxy-L-arabinose transferase-like glycosyltransferase